MPHIEDLDTDGADLVEYINKPNDQELSTLAEDFGRINCAKYDSSQWKPIYLKNNSASILNNSFSKWQKNNKEICAFCCLRQVSESLKSLVIAGSYPYKIIGNWKSSYFQDSSSAPPSLPCFYSNTTKFYNLPLYWIILELGLNHYPSMFPRI